jgi:arylsulfatase A-like enzyme
VVWDGSWKYIHNGFDFDELYNLDEDPHELKNLASHPAFKQRLQQMTMRMWQRIRQTGDRSLLDAYYPILRMAPVGPGFQQA